MANVRAEVGGRTPRFSTSPDSDLETAKTPRGTRAGTLPALHPMGEHLEQTPSHAPLRVFRVFVVPYHGIWAESEIEPPRHQEQTSGHGV